MKKFNTIPSHSSTYKTLRPGALLGNGIKVTLAGGAAVTLASNAITRPAPALSALPGKAEARRALLEYAKSPPVRRQDSNVHVAKMLLVD